MQISLASCEFLDNDGTTKMQLDTTKIGTEQSADHRTTAGGKLRFRTIAYLDGRTLAARKAAALAAAFELEIEGPITPTVRLAIDRAAQLQALAEDLRVRRLSGDVDVSLVDLTRVEGLAARAVASLGLKRRATPKPSLREYLNRLATAEAVKASP
jgi:hypothetical protein